MTTPSNPSDPSIEDRLRALGASPVDPATRAAHLRRAESGSAAAAGLPPRRRFGPLAVGAAAVIGFLAGSTGLAMAGALPNAAQDVAHDVLGVVQVDVPQGSEGKRGPCVAEAAKLDDEEAKRAAKDACPKGNPHDDPDGTPGKSGDAPGRSGDAPGRSGDAPGRSGDAPGRSGDAPGRSGDAPGRSGDAPGRSGDAPGRSGTDRHADDPCRGKPPWAGPMSQDERAELKDEFSRDGCVDDASEVDDTGD